MLKVGCSGFPVAMDRYWRSFSFVEAATGEAMPRAATLAGWRAGAPAPAEFSVQAFRLVTHGPSDPGFPPAGKRLAQHRQLQCGAFRETLEVHEAWMATKAAAEALGARAVFFDLPRSFQPGADRLRDLYRFFKTAARAKLAFVWRPRSPAWTPGVMERVEGDLGLIRAFDPLAEAGPKRGAFRYIRPRGPRAGTFSAGDLSAIWTAAMERPSYVVLSHRDAFRDAEKMTGL